MNRISVILFVLAGISLTQCRASREVPEPVHPGPVGMEGFRWICSASDTIHSITVSGAETLISMDNERYEAQVTLHAIRDSIIYISAVNNGFEILRAAADPDTIRVIDRLNKVVYRTPVKRRFGYQNPVNFQDVQNLVSRYNLCDDLEEAREQDFYKIVFIYDEPQIKKQIALNRETLQMDRFEFTQTQTGKYIRGERNDGGFRIFSNFIVAEFEINAHGGAVTYNQEIPVKMQVNPKRYTYINF